MTAGRSSANQPCGNCSATGGTTDELGGLARPAHHHRARARRDPSALTARPKSGHTGVTWDNKTHKWRARATKDGERQILGYFDDVMDAVQAMRDFREGKLPLREKPLRKPNAPASVSFDVPRQGKWVGTPVHLRGCNWLVVKVLPGGKTATVRRYQDGSEADAPLSECSRPSWWEDR